MGKRESAADPDETNAASWGGQGVAFAAREEEDVHAAASEDLAGVPAIVCAGVGAVLLTASAVGKASAHEAASLAWRH